MGDIDNEIIKNKIEEKKDQTSEEDEEDIEKDRKEYEYGFETF